MNFLNTFKAIIKKFAKCKNCGQRVHWREKFPAGKFKYCPAWKSVAAKIGAKNLLDFHEKLCRFEVQQGN